MIDFTAIPLGDVMAKRAWVIHQAAIQKNNTRVFRQDILPKIDTYHIHLCLVEILKPPISEFVAGLHFLALRDGDRDRDTYEVHYLTKDESYFLSDQLMQAVKGDGQGYVQYPPNEYQVTNLAIVCPQSTREKVMAILNTECEQEPVVPTQGWRGFTMEEVSEFLDERMAAMNERIRRGFPRFATIIRDQIKIEKSDAGEIKESGTGKNPPDRQGVKNR